MFWPLFFSGKEIVLEKLSIFSKIPQKLTVFQDIYDCHLIQGGKQQLKQVENYFMIPWPSFDTHQTQKRAMIREVERVLSLFSNFYNDDTTFEPFPTRFENTNEYFCIVQGINTTISKHYQSKIVKNSNFYKPGFCLFARFSGFISHSELILFAILSFQQIFGFQTKFDHTYK